MVLRLRATRGVGVEGPSVERQVELEQGESAKEQVLRLQCRYDQSERTRKGSILDTEQR